MVGLGDVAEERHTIKLARGVGAEVASSVSAVFTRRSTCYAWRGGVDSQTRKSNFDTAIGVTEITSRRPLMAGAN